MNADKYGVLPFKEASKLVSSDAVGQHVIETTTKHIDLFPWEFQKGFEKLMSKFAANSNSDIVEHGFIVAVAPFRLCQTPMIHDCQGGVRLTGITRRVIFYPNTQHSFDTFIVSILDDVIIGRTYTMETHTLLSDFNGKVPKPNTTIKVFFKSMEEKDNMAILLCTHSPKDE